MPTLSGPGCDSIAGIGTISFELAILNFIARIRPAMAGETTADFLASQQLLHVGDEIFAKMISCCDSVLSDNGSKLAPEERDALWVSDPQA